MMMGMRLTPVVVWGQCQNCQRTPNPVIRGTARKHRSMPTIVLDHKQPNKESGRRKRNDQASK